MMVKAMGEFSQKMKRAIQCYRRKTTAKAHEPRQGDNGQPTVRSKDGPLQSDSAEPAGKNHLDVPAGLTTDSIAAILDQISSIGGWLMR